MRILDKLANYVQNTLWAKVTFVNYMMLPLSLVYMLVKNIRYYFLQTPYTAESKVVCVGSSISGGAGKTPIVIRIVELLYKEKRVAVVTRGYKGQISNFQKAIKVDLKKHTYKDVGDEAILIAQYTDVYISSNRKLSVKTAQESGAEIIILDDGLQNTSIHKDISIFVMAHDDVKNTFLIPAGPMRETLLTTLQKADIVIAYKNNINVLSKKYLLGKDVFYQKRVIGNAKEIEGKEYVLLCAIAQPQRVVSTAKEIGAKIKSSYIYHDHYSFCEAELDAIYAEAKQHRCKVLTTMKDYVRLPKKYYKETIVIDYHAELENEDKLKEKIIFSA
jgi:tetraacyldisaccharide 4'-kinase